jgi:excinuclease ABC subunit A
MVIDRIKVSEKDTKRLSDSLNLAMKHGKGIMMILDTESNEAKFYSQKLMCPTTGISYNEPAPHSFSFNSPQGACHKCKGLGTVDIVDIDKVIPDDSLSIHQGGISPLGKYKNTLIFWQLEAIAEKHHFTLKTPIRDIPEEALDTILHGSSEPITLKNTPLGTTSNYFISFEGVIKYILQQQTNETSKKAKKWAMQFVTSANCAECQGQRLNKQALHFKVNNQNIAQLAKMDLSQLAEWFQNIEENLNPKQKVIATEILKEIRSRLGFLLDVGLGYLSLNRSAMTLSGGESQRIRLATQIGSQLVNVLYILDEPSIGLHQRDNHKLIHSLQQLRDTGNTILVVEHDKDMMLQADYLIDMGPFAGSSRHTH